jgi:hypothetical protein
MSDVNQNISIGSRQRFTRQQLFGFGVRRSITIHNGRLYSEGINPNEVVELDEAQFCPANKLAEADSWLHAGNLDNAAIALIESTECLNILLMQAAWHRRQAEILEDRHKFFKGQYRQRSRRISREVFKTLMRRVWPW